MVDLKATPTTSKAITGTELRLESQVNHRWQSVLSFLTHSMIVIFLASIASESFAVDLDKFGKGVTVPIVRFAQEYWVYGAGIGGIATSLLSEGDGRIRIIRGGTVFLGSSAICMGILAALN